MPTTTSPCGPYSFARPTIIGYSSRQGPHHVAQNVTISGLPWYRATMFLYPFRSSSGMLPDSSFDAAALAAAACGRTTLSAATSISPSAPNASKVRNATRIGLPPSIPCALFYRVNHRNRRQSTYPLLLVSHVEDVRLQPRFHAARAIRLQRTPFKSSRTRPHRDGRQLGQECVDRGRPRSRVEGDSLCTTVAEFKSQPGNGLVCAPRALFE